ncbi:MAG: ABC transporter ATP-binding protein [Arenicella sp.]
MLLELKDVYVYYQQVAAVKGISLQVEEADFVTLIGANGAGKSTTLRAISGLEQPRSGEIIFAGKNIEKLAADKILKLGIAHVPEGRRVFKDLSVEENLRLGAFVRNDTDVIEQDIDKMYSYFPRLRERKGQLARTMSGGEQQMLAIARALMSRPKLLLLDEPSLGLAPVIVRDIANIMLEINQQGVAIVLVEQNADLALELANQGYVLETGAVTLQGETKGLVNNDHVRKAYLGI